MSLELGGKNAVIVMDDANLDEAVAAVAWAGFGTTGQRCTATSRVIVHQAVAEAFAEKLVAAAEKLQIGDGLLPRPIWGRWSIAGRVDAVHEYTEIGKAEGAKLLTGGHPLNEGDLRRGRLLRADCLHRRDDRYAHRAGGGLWAVRLDPPGCETMMRPSPSPIRRSMASPAPSSRRIRAYGLPRDARHQRRLIYINAGTTGAEPHHALWRDEAERQRPPRARPEGGRGVQRDQDGVCLVSVDTLSPGPSPDAPHWSPWPSLLGEGGR